MKCYSDISEMVAFCSCYLLCDNRKVLCSSVMWIEDKITDFTSGLTPSYAQDSVSQNSPTFKTTTKKDTISKF